MAATALAILAGASLAHQIEQGKQQRRLAGQAANGQRQAVTNMMRDQQNQAAADEATKAAIEQRRRQRQMTMERQGRMGTILTGSGDSVSGVMPQAPMMGKTLLGQ